MVAVGGHTGHNGTSDQLKLNRSCAASGIKMPLRVPTRIVRKSVAGIIHELTSVSASAVANIEGRLAAPCGSTSERTVYITKTIRFDTKESIRHQVHFAAHIRSSGIPLQSMARFPKRASAFAIVVATSVIETGISKAYQ